MKEFVDAVKRLVDLMPSGAAIRYYYARDELEKVRELLGEMEKLTVKLPLQSIYGHHGELPGMWDESDLIGGEADCAEDRKPQEISVYDVYTGVRDKKGQWIENGDIVRRSTLSRKYEYAQVVNVYVNGAIDVLLNGKQYRWSSENVEVANCTCFAASDEEHVGNCPLRNAP